MTGAAARPSPDPRVQMAGGEVAIVSFHPGAENPSRRSPMFRSTPVGGWKVVHWPASPTPQRQASPPSGGPSN